MIESKKSHLEINVTETLPQFPELNAVMIVPGFIVSKLNAWMADNRFSTVMTVENEPRDSFARAVITVSGSVQEVRRVQAFVEGVHVVYETFKERLPNYSRYPGGV
jgi:hypothetical protein